MGMVNFLSMFCLELQKLLKPMYDLTRKGRDFIWGKEQQIAFEEIKCRLVRPPVLQLPNSTGRFHLYSNRSKFCYGKWIISNTKQKTKINSIYKQKITRSSKVIVGYLALMHIIKSKAEPATTGTKRLLELITSYSFNLYYIKGKDMILSEFVSREKHDDSYPHEIRSISLICTVYYTINITI